MKILPRLGLATAVFSATVIFPCAGDDQSSSEEATCKSNGNDADDGTCKLAEDVDKKTVNPKQRRPPRKTGTLPRKRFFPRNGPVSTTFQNDSPYQVDIYFDDGWFGEVVGTAKANGGEVKVDTFPFFRFFVTVHGATESLVDQETDDAYYQFTISKENIGKGELFVLPKTAAPLSLTKCKDRYPVCASAAKQGECTRNPGWMIINCCKSCDDKEGFGYLLDSKIRCDPERLNATTPAWNSGSLNDLFTKWATDDIYKQYEPHVISSPEKKELYGAEVGEGPWIIAFDNFLDNFEILQLLEGASYGEGFQQSIDYVSDPEGDVEESATTAAKKTTITSTYRTSSSAWCNQKCGSLPGVQSLTKRIEEMTGIPQNNYESFQIVQYQQGQYYKPHHDSSNANKDRIAGHRVLTFLLYLNDVGEGGETKFTSLDISVKPKKGRALVWPSVLNDDPNASDMRMIHGGMDVIKGTKYTTNLWKLTVLNIGHYHAWNRDKSSSVRFSQCKHVGVQWNFRYLEIEFV